MKIINPVCKCDEVTKNEDIVIEKPDEWFERGIGQIQARFSSGKSSNLPIGQEDIDN